MHKLTKQGYIINKNDITESQLQSIINDLTIEVKADQYHKEEETFNIYQETVSGDKIVIPRYYGIEKFGYPDNVKININDIDKININFTGELREYQQHIINTILPNYCTEINNPKNTLKPYGGSIITIPPGQGKTVLGIFLAVTLGLRTLVIVNKTFLLNQWKERISQYTNANIGIIRQNNININNKDIVVGMLHSISMKDYDKELLKAFPLIIYDECHHLGAKIFSKSLMKVAAPYYLGLSATPERRDHLDKIFKYFLGNIEYRGKFEPNDSVKVKIYMYESNNPKFKSIYSNYLKRYLIQTMITNLCKINERNKLIVDIIKNILSEEPERKILLLTGRCNASKSTNSVNHVKEISDLLNNIEGLTNSWGYYIGGMKKIQLELTSEKQIILGTYDMAQEGLDIPMLDTLILATPLKGNITQTCGRIFRGKNINNPLIIDIVDNITPFQYQAKSRYKYYFSNQYLCTFYNVKNNIITLTNQPLIYKSIITTENNDEIFLD